MNILLMGGSQFIGKHIASSLLDLGKVFLLNRGTKQPHNTSLTLIKADRTDPESLAVLHDKAFDVIVDVSAEQSVFVSNTLPYLEHSAGAKYIYISSGSVYAGDSTEGKPLKECAPTGGGSHWGEYGVEKSQCESLLNDSEFDCYMLRPPYVYGADNNCDREQFIWARILNDKPVFIPDEPGAKIQFIWINDLCRIVCDIAANEKNISPGTYNIGEPAYYSFEDYVKLLGRVTEKSPQIKKVYPAVPARTYFPFRSNSMALDLNASTQVFGAYTDLSNGMRETLNWCEAKGAIKYNPTELELSYPSINQFRL